MSAGGSMNIRTSRSKSNPALNASGLKPLTSAGITSPCLTKNPSDCLSQARNKSGQRLRNVSSFVNRRWKKLGITHLYFLFFGLSRVQLFERVRDVAPDFRLGQGPS